MPVRSTYRQHSSVQLGDRPSFHNDQIGRIIWINGPPGAGKSAVAELVVDALSWTGEQSCLYDPEELGESLRAHGRCVGDNYRECEEWRDGTHDVIASRADSESTIVVPQTLERAEYMEEIVDPLRAHVELRHFTLVASVDTCLRRIDERSQNGATTGQWSRVLLPSIVRELEHPRFEVFIQTDDLTKAEVAVEILGLV